MWKHYKIYLTLGIILLKMLIKNIILQREKYQNVLIMKQEIYVFIQLYLMPLVLMYKAVLDDTTQ